MAEKAHNYRNTRPESPKGQVFKVFMEKGEEAAVRKAKTLDVAPVRYNRWCRTWAEGGDKPGSGYIPPVFGSTKAAAPAKKAAPGKKAAPKKAVPKKVAAKKASPAKKAVPKKAPAKPRKPRAEADTPKAAPAGSNGHDTGAELPPAA
jgi:hypothetical protein